MKLALPAPPCPVLQHPRPQSRKDAPRRRRRSYTRPWAGPSLRQCPTSSHLIPFASCYPIPLSLAPTSLHVATAPLTTLPLLPSPRPMLPVRLAALAIPGRSRVIRPPLSTGLRPLTPRSPTPAPVAIPAPPPVRISALLLLATPVPLPLPLAAPPTLISATMPPALPLPLPMLPLIAIPFPISLPFSTPASAPPLAATPLAATATPAAAAVPALTVAPVTPSGMTPAPPDVLSPLCRSRLAPCPPPEHLRHHRLERSPRFCHRRRCLVTSRLLPPTRSARALPLRVRLRQQRVGVHAPLLQPLHDSVQIRPGVFVLWIDLQCLVEEEKSHGV